MPGETLTVFYDGDCPLCNRYVCYTRLRQSLDVELRDLRNDPDSVARFKARGLDVDRGMIVNYAGKTYHGAEALHLLALLASPSNVFNRITRFIFSRRWLARALYPLLVSGRNLLLLILGRKKINSR